MRDVGGHRYCDQGTDCEQENSRTAADADVPQEAGCRLWRQRSVLRWQERNSVKVGLRPPSSVTVSRSSAMRRLPAGGLGVRQAHRWPRSSLGGLGHHGRFRLEWWDGGAGTEVDMRSCVRLQMHRVTGHSHLFVVFCCCFCCFVAAAAVRPPLALVGDGRPISHVTDENAG